MRTTVTGPSEPPDRWEREIRYQKINAMTPSEASLLVSKEDGESVEDIARTNGLSIQTVKNTLTKARKKITEKEGEPMEIYIIKPTQNGDNAMMKINMSLVLARMCSRITDWKVDYLTHIIRISNIDKADKGSIDWMNEKVFRYVDIIGTRVESDADMRADRIETIYNQRMEESGETDSKMGWAVLKYWLDRYYISYDIMEGA